MSDNKTKLIDAIEDFRKSNTRSLKYHIDVFFNRILPDALYPGNYFYDLREAIRENLTGWSRHLIWCPSQVTKTIQYKSYDVTLYLRWRHNDPWTAEFIIENDHVIIWSEELIGNKNFTEETPIRVLELEMEKLYKKYFVDKTERLKLSHRRFKNGWACDSEVD
jgi:hypothetical protein